jgi:hypothetical protein
MEAALRAREQALEDIAASAASEVVFVRYEQPSALATFSAGLLDRAVARRFVTADLSLLGDRGFDALDSLVRTIIRTLGPPHLPPEERGLPALLDAFVEKRGERARDWFESGTRREACYGDLTELCRDYIEARLAERHRMARFDTWLSGVSPERTDADVPVLSSKNAKRALGELSRLVRVLGFRGLLVLVTRGETLVKLPQARRRDAYTVLRELVDNVDGGRGLVATQIVVIAKPELFSGPRSIETLTPLAMRVGAPRGGAGSAPHRTLVDLAPTAAPAALPEVQAPDKAAARELRAIIRAGSGLPPTEAVPSLSVGYEKIERTIERLLEVSALQGSVFSLLVGAYGSGKTHLLLHLAERALEDGRPVLRLAVEQLDVDLGQPQRHLRRLLEDSTLPLEGRPSMMDLLHAWTSKPSRTERLLETLERLASREDEVGENARRIVRAARQRRTPARALEALLGAKDLLGKTAAKSHRAAAYGRLLLWLTLLEELEGLKGPVVFIDEAENLYRGGVTRAERRTALRSLAFYCSGVIASGCVVLALTPEAGAELAEECSALLREVDEQSSTLPWEDASMLERRLRQTKPIAVPALKADAALDLAEHVRKAHRAVRGKVRAPGLEALVAELSRARANPRVIVRSVVDHLESAWWSG